MTPAPPKSERTPAVDRDAFYCPHCGTFANQTWFTLQYLVTTDGTDSLEEARDGQTWHSSNGYNYAKYAGEWKMSHCSACGDRATWRSERLMFPAGGTAAHANEDMPAPVRELYEEAREVAAVSRRAGAALARATLERFLRDYDAEAPAGINLASRIDRVIPNVSSSLGELLTLVRHVGNKALHTDDEPDDAVVLVLDQDNTDMIDAIFATVNDLVEELITKPKRTSKLTAMVPQSVRDRVAKKRIPEEGVGPA